ncbi:hypothetical protein HDU67_005387 [Dinochytrium kinnereticum]|nr:hypothetical protein HDU67_005387 [Dinochytrium kinnereticum]
MPELSEIRIGMANIFLQHTSASLTLNENADPDVRIDMETALNKLAPEGHTLYVHSDEGLDDMPGHIKSSLMGVSLNVPVSNGRLNLGTWQGLEKMLHTAETIIMMKGEFRCPCLNLCIQVAKVHDAHAGDTPAAFADYRRVTMNLGGITMMHPSLTEVYVDASGWTVMRCLNCSIITYATPVVTPETKRAFDAAGFIFVSPEMKSGPEIQASKEHKDYSETFGIVLFGIDDSSAIAKVESDTPAFESLRITYQNYVNTQKQSTQQAILDFTKKQNEILEKKLSRAETEKNVLFTRMQSRSRTDFQGVEPGIPRVTSALSTKSAEGPTTPSVPSVTASPTPTKSATAGPSRKVHFAVSDNTPNVPPATPSAEDPDSDDMFALDEEDSVERKKAYIDEDPGDVNQVEAADEDVLTAPESGSLLSSSIPIGIPQSFRKQDTLREDSGMQAEESDDFVAPHILVARSYTMSESLSGRPSPRKASLAI